MKCTRNLEIHSKQYLVTMCNRVECKEDINFKNQFLASMICFLSSVWDIFGPHSEEIGAPSIIKSRCHLFLLKLKIQVNLEIEDK